MRELIYACVVLSSACADISTRVNVAPSAMGKFDDISTAIEQLNAIVKTDAYTLDLTVHERRADNEVVVRGREELGQRVRGLCTRELRGIVVLVTPDSSALQVAHELGHAARLKHVDDRSNLMHPQAQRWGLTEAQIDKILEAKR